MVIKYTTLKKILLGLCVVVIVGCSSTSSSDSSPTPGGDEQDTDTTKNTDGEQDIAPTTIPDDGEQDLDQTPIPDEDEQVVDTETFTGTYEEHDLGGHTLIVQGSGDDQTKRLEIAPTTTTITRGSFGSSAFSTQPLITIQRLIIPGSVRSIGQEAFRKNKLTELTIPDSVQSIGAGAFVHNALETLTIPNSVTSIGFGAFWGNSNLKVTMPEETFKDLGAAVLRDAFPENTKFLDENGNAY